MRQTQHAFRRVPEPTRGQAEVNEQGSVAFSVCDRATSP